MDSKHNSPDEDLGYQPPEPTPDEKIAKGKKFLRMLAQSRQLAIQRERLSKLPIQAGTDSVN